MIFQLTCMECHASTERPDDWVEVQVRYEEMITSIVITCPRCETSVDYSATGKGS